MLFSAHAKQVTLVLVAAVVAAAAAALPALPQAGQPSPALTAARGLDLDFAVVGFPKCGTTSLGTALRSLAAQVSRNFSGLPLERRSQEDEFFYFPGAARSPLGRLRFNDRRFDVSEGHAVAGGGRRLRFVQETPLVAYYPDSLRVLAEVPGLKAIAMVRDPAEQFVSFYENFHVRAGFALPPLLQLAVDVRRHRRSHQPSHSEDATPLWGPLPLTVLHSIYNHAGRFAEPLAQLRGLFGSRLLVVHLDELALGRAASREALSAVLNFLGLPANHSTKGIPRANKGAGLDRLCGRNASARGLRRVLMEMLVEEYDLLYSSLGPFGHLRRGPCEHPRRPQPEPPS